MLAALIALAMLAASPDGGATEPADTTATASETESQTAETKVEEEEYVCRLEAPMDSRIKKRRCYKKSELEATQESLWSPMVLTGN